MGARAPTFTNGGARGAVSRRTAYKQLYQTVLTITKALTKTTNCTFRANKVEGQDKKISGTLRLIGPPPTFALDQCPHFQIRSGATGCIAL